MICDECCSLIVRATELRRLVIKANKYFEANERNIDHCDEEDDDDVLLEVASSYNEDTMDCTTGVDEIEYLMDENSTEVETNEKGIISNEEKTTVTENQIITCPQCPKTFASIYGLRNHLPSHKILETFKCIHCGRAYNTESELQGHVEVFHVSDSEEKQDVIILSCDYCEEKSPYYAYMMMHMRDKHNKTDKIALYKCDRCEVRCSSRANLKRHAESIHDNIKREIRKPVRSFLCNVCGEIFPSNFKLDIHMRVHTGFRFKCDLCDKSFLQLTGLRMHQQIHTENAFVCNVCDRKFSKNVYLKTHMALHSEDRKFVCSICSYRFRTKRNLNEHFLDHSKNEQHTCEHCGRKYVHLRNLEHHLLNARCQATKLIDFKK